MVAGLGIDICNLERMEKLASSQRFLNRVFTDEEQGYAQGKESRVAHLAGAFAVKEAFAKATGLGLSKMGLKSVSLAHDENGKPFIRLAEGISTLDPFRDGTFFVSLSHDAGIAAAVVVYERRDS